MLDEKTLKKRVLLRLLGSPFTVLPFMLGMTAMTAGWVLDWRPAMALFSGAAGALCAAGAFFTRLVLNGESVARRVATEVEQEEQQARQRALDDLDNKLRTADKDPRPENALRDLRALVKAFEEGSADYFRFNAGTMVEVHSRVGQLFDHCVDSLRQTDRLWQTAQQLRTVSARQPILDQREKIVEEVQASIKQLSDTLVTMQTLGAGERSEGQLARLRDELDQSLAIAKTVEERVNDLVNEATVKTPKIKE
jgi:hypothetical protein